MTGNDAALQNRGVNGDVSGNIVATNPSDPIFNGINLSAVTYYHNGNFAHPGWRRAPRCWPRTERATI